MIKKMKVDSFVSPRHIRKWLRASSVVQRIYYSLHLDDLSIILRLGSFENQIDHAIRKFRPEALESKEELNKLKTQAIS